MDYEAGLAALEGRAKLAMIALWMFVVVAMLAGFGQALEALKMVDVETGEDPLTLLVALIYVLYMVVFIACVVLVGRWIHRAHANLVDAGNEGLEFTPGWAVGWYFVPFANLFKPFQAMRELWTTSHAAHDRLGAEAPGEIKAWWAAWIGGNILSSVADRIQLSAEGGSSGLTVGFAIGVVATVGVVIAAVLLTRIISGVTEAQRSGSGALAAFA